MFYIFDSNVCKISNDTIEQWNRSNVILLSFSNIKCEHSRTLTCHIDILHVHLMRVIPNTMLCINIRCVQFISKFIKYCCISYCKQKLRSVHVGTSDSRFINIFHVQVCWVYNWPVCLFSITSVCLFALITCRSKTKRKQMYVLFSVIYVHVTIWWRDNE